MVTHPDIKGRLAALINHREDQVLVFDMGSTEWELDRFVYSIGQDLKLAEGVQIV